MLILAIDPSGNFKEGKGVTGFAWGDENGKLYGTTVIKAENYKDIYAYWEAIAEFATTAFKHVADVHWVIEDYILYNTRSQKAQTQSWSSLETSKLIGYLISQIPEPEKNVTMQRALDIKTPRYTNENLVRKGYAMKVGRSYQIIIDGATYPTMEHERDALRHYLHYVEKNKCKKKESQ